jgi:hypothetical protein
MFRLTGSTRNSREVLEKGRILFEMQVISSGWYKLRHLWLFENDRKTRRFADLGSGRIVFSLRDWGGIFQKRRHVFY